jgi:hypothetical protein
VLVVQELPGAAPADGGELSGGELVGTCPADEVAGLEAVDARVVAVPAVEIALGAAAQGELVRGEPVQERGGGAGVAADAQRLLPGGRTFEEPVANVMFEYGYLSARLSRGPRSFQDRLMLG